MNSTLSGSVVPIEDALLGFYWTDGNNGLDDLYAIYTGYLSGQLYTCLYPW